MTAAFLAAYRNLNGRELYGLIELQMPTSYGPYVDTLYVSTREVITPAGGGFNVQLWQKGVARFGPLRARGTFGTSEVTPVTFSFELENRDYAYSTGAVGSLDSILRTHYMQGTKVLARLWLSALAGGSFVDAGLVFPGFIEEVENKADRTVFTCKQRSDWNRDITVDAVNKNDHPNADESAVGQPIPRYWGSIKGVALIVPPFPDPYGAGSTTGRNHLYRDVCHGIRGAARCVVVDMGRGGTGSKGKALVAAHKVKSLGVPTSAPHGTSIGLAEGEHVSVFDAAAADIFALTSGSGFYIPDEFDAVYAPVYPGSVRGFGGFNPTMPRAVLDPYSLGYCRIDQTDKAVEYTLPSLNDLGEAVRIGLVCCYRSSNPAAQLKAGLFNIATGGSMITPLPASTSIAIAIVDNGIPPLWAAAVGAPNVPYDFAQCTLRAYFDAGSSGTADIFYLGVFVRHKAGRKVISPYRVDHAQLYYKKHPGDANKTFGWVDVSNAAISVVTGQFFANLEGYADDGEFDTAGNFTGGASGTLIERAPDIEQHLLVACGKEPAANIERGASVHGSFVDARDAMKSWRQGEMPFSLKVSKTTPVADALRDLSRDAVSWCFLSHLDDKWKYVPWRMGAPVNYRIFEREDIGNPETFVARMSPTTDILTSISLRYLHDDFTDGYLYETGCARASSLAGYEFLNQRDQSFVVVTGANDKIDWTDGTLNYTATIAAGAYTTQGAIGAVYDALQASSARDWSVGCGGTVMAGKNDAFKFTDGAGAHTVTLSPGTKTMEARAAELELLLRAISSTYSVTYTRATGIFLITKTGIPTWSLNTVVASAYAMLGIRPTARLGIHNVGSDIPVEEERFIIGYPAGATFSILWRTGTNGWANAVLTNIKTAAPVLGYLPSDDAVGAYLYVGVSPRGEREAVLEAATRYGEHPRFEITSETIRSTETAREIRNRRIDMMSKPRVIVEFPTDRAPDIDRGQVIGFGSSLDGYVRAYPEPGSDGLWFGKRFVVIELNGLTLGPQTCSIKLGAVSLG